VLDVTRLERKPDTIPDVRDGEDFTAGLRFDRGHTEQGRDLHT